MSDLYANPLLWVAVAFFSFIIVSYKPLSKKITEGLDSRTNRIKHELDEALKLKEEAQELLATYQKRQKEIVDESKKIILHAEEEAERIKKNAEENIEEKINRRVELALQKINSYETQVLKEVRENAVDIALGAVRALVVENISKEAAQEIVNKAITDIENNFH